MSQRMLIFHQAFGYHPAWYWLPAVGIVTYHTIRFRYLGWVTVRLICCDIRDLQFNITIYRFLQYFPPTDFMLEYFKNDSKQYKPWKVMSHVLQWSQIKPVYTTFISAMVHYSPQYKNTKISWRKYNYVISIYHNIWEYWFFLAHLYWLPCYLPFFTQVLKFVGQTKHKGHFASGCKQRAKCAVF